MNSGHAATWRWITVTLACAVLIPCARAEAARVPLTLAQGATCLEEDTLADELEARLQGPVDETLRVQVLGSVHDPRTALIQVLRDQEPLAQRSFSPGPPRCNDFHAAVALAIAMMLRNLEAEAAPEHVPEPEPEPPPPPRPAPPVVQRERVFGVRASGVLGSHVASSLAGGAKLELVLGRGWSLRAGMLALTSSSQRLADTQVHYRTVPWVARLSGCAPLRQASDWLLHACVGVMAGRLRMHARAQQAVQAAAAQTDALWMLAAELSLARRLAGNSWLFFEIEPSYGLRQLGVSAGYADREGSVRQRLPRLGALFSLGFAYEFSRFTKEPARSGMNER